MSNNGNKLVAKIQAQNGSQIDVVEFFGEVCTLNPIIKIFSVKLIF